MEKKKPKIIIEFRVKRVELSLGEYNSEIGFQYAIIDIVHADKNQSLKIEDIIELNDGNKYAVISEEGKDRYMILLIGEDYLPEYNLLYMYGNAKLTGKANIKL